MNPKTPAQKSAAAKAAMLKRNPDGVHRGARAGTCRRCGANVFTGLDAERCAMSVTADAAPLSATGEVFALMAGRPTYSLTWFAGRGRYEIDNRDQYNIEANPPGSHPNIDVVADHRCGTPPLPRLNTMMVRKTNKPIPIDPPF